MLRQPHGGPMSRTIATLRVVGLLLIGLLAGKEAFAQPAKGSSEPYYAGKRVQLLIGTTPGSGADLLARVMARYLSKAMPRSPPVIAQNMPGGGSVVMMNYLYNVAAHDGTVMGITVGGIYMRHLF